MKTTQNTILITGGTAGIGFEIAKLFSTNNNHVIILGRNKERLEKAAAQLSNVTAINADVTKEADVNRVVDIINRDFPNLNVLINNAGQAYMYKLVAGANAFEKAADEILTNYLSVIRLTEKLLPVLQKQPSSAVVNVSSVVALVPGTLGTYSASKAALRSYTQSLRLVLEGTSVKVIELMPPLVDTEFSKEIGGANGIKPSVVAQDLLSGFENDEEEIHVGITAEVYKVFASSPTEAFKMLAGQRKQPVK